ncbi:hypothetical protein FDP41_001905 [Naegleria fowleri]|uniref:Uncharacterized protein n=1 Tax=Naegleria fowleri TaxID=5763 RepID=A0A6A5BZT8_NAEFO|nr:uncharacterized protein FDP41_001905 [Naegleria fowleri]KAF0978835.1 hypothetical protein FDP41_001905 [Naegleria fowleri]
MMRRNCCSRVLRGVLSSSSLVKNKSCHMMMVNNQMFRTSVVAMMMSNNQMASVSALVNSSSGNNSVRNIGMNTQNSNGILPTPLVFLANSDDDGV